MAIKIRTGTRNIAHAILLRTIKPKEYPLAVLLPVIMELIFPPVEDSINLASPHEPDSTELVPYPAWIGEYNDILQSNTCSTIYLQSLAIE